MKLMKSISVLFLAMLLAAAFAVPAGAEGSCAVRVQVFRESSSNGERSIYEEGCADVTVILLREDGTAAGEAVSDKTGLIEFTGLAAGTYRLRAELPDGLIFGKISKAVGIDKSCMNISSETVQESESFTLQDGETRETAISVQRGLSVSGTVWIDENRNGLMDDEEPRYAGARITMEGQKNGLSYEAFSGEDGAWIIRAVRPGFYDLTSYVPDGMMFARYTGQGGKSRSYFTAEGRSQATRTLDTNDGVTVTNVNIGFSRSATVSGMCFLDANYNGLYDEGELPMAGVKVTAIKEYDDSEVAVTFSGEDGRYTLTGLRGSTYRIRAVLPDDGSTFTVVSEDPLGSHFQAREGRRENFWKNFFLTDGENRTVNVGAIYYASVSGKVYLDDDFSGTQTGSEKVVQGIAVALLNENGETVDTAKTTAKGTFTFKDLVPGTYALHMTAKKGYAFTRPGEEKVILNLTGGEGRSEAFEVPLGAEISDMSAGMILPAAVEGSVFADLNDNGVRDEGEGGLTGTVVTLMTGEEEAFRTVIDESGSFLFDAAMPGTYVLRYELPEHSVFAAVTAGGNTITGEGTTGESGSFTLKTGDLYKAPLCGALTLGRISGTVHQDSDGSGLRNGEEAFLSGAVLSLIPARADLETVSVTTGEDGAFLLDNIRPGTYTLRLTLPETLTVTRLNGTELQLIPGLHEESISLSVPMGLILDGQQIGAVLPGRISGAAWLDENCSGTRDEGERAFSGAQLRLTDENDDSVFFDLTTGADGSFAAEGLMPGSYMLTCTLDDRTKGAPAGDSSFTEEDGSLVIRNLIIAEGENREGLLMGVIRYAFLSGRVWIDRNSEITSLAGAEVALTDAGGAVLQSMETDEEGTWSFGWLLPGEYRIRAELPEGCLAVEPDDERLEAGLISVLEETDGRTGTSGKISLQMDENLAGMDIGSVLPGTIGDFCWLDVDGDGWQDGGEFGIPGVRIELMRNGTAVSATVSDQYGLYWFREVYPAVYTLRITPPAEVKPTQKRTDIPLIVSSVNETEGTECSTDPIAVQSDVINYNVDLGFTCRTPGVYPEGYGEGKRMDWSRTFEPK